MKINVIFVCFIRSQLCNVEEEKSQHSGDNILSSNVHQVPGSKLITSETKFISISKCDVKRKDSNNQDELSSSSLSSEYASPSHKHNSNILDKAVSKNNLENDYKFRKHSNQATKAPGPLNLNEKMDKLAVARQCLNSVTDLSTDELSTNGNVSKDNIDSMSAQF